MVEQLVRQGFQVALAELQPQVLPLLDAEMAQPLEDALRRHGVTLYLGDGIKRILTDERNAATGVELQSGQVVQAELVILGLGVRPNIQLAQEAGLTIGAGGGIAANEYQQTNDPDIYAVGDAAEYVFGRTGQPLRIAVGRPGEPSRPAGRRARGDRPVACRWLRCSARRSCGSSTAPPP